MAGVPRLVHLLTIIPGRFGPLLRGIVIVTVSFWSGVALTAFTLLVRALFLGFSSCSFLLTDISSSSSSFLLLLILLLNSIRPDLVEFILVVFLS